MILFRLGEVGLTMEKGSRLLERLVRGRDWSKALSISQALLWFVEVRNHLAVLVFDHGGFV